MFELSILYLIWYCYVSLWWALALDLVTCGFVLGF